MENKDFFNWLNHYYNTIFDYQDTEPTRFDYELKVLNEENGINLDELMITINKVKNNFTYDT